MLALRSQLPCVGAEPQLQKAGPQRNSQQGTCWSGPLDTHAVVGMLNAKHDGNQKQDIANGQQTGYAGMVAGYPHARFLSGKIGRASSRERWWIRNGRCTVR